MGNFERRGGTKKSCYNRSAVGSKIGLWSTQGRQEKRGTGTRPAIEFKNKVVQKREEEQKREQRQGG